MSEARTPGAGDQPLNEEEEIRTVLADAGPRLAVPERDFERIKSGARQEWLRLTENRAIRRRRDRYRWGALAAGLLLASGVVWWSQLGTGSADPQLQMVVAQAESGAHVDLVTGTVLLSGQPIAAGDPLPLRVPLATSAADGSSGAAIRLESGHSVRLNEGSEILLLGPDAVELIRGTVYVDSGPQREGKQPIRIETPYGGVTEVGTQYEVSFDADRQAPLRIRVREGAVRLESESQPVEAGTELRIEGDVHIRSSLAPYDPDWDWLIALSPGLDYLDPSLARVLEWCARERGWTLELGPEVREATAYRETLSWDPRLRPTESEALEALRIATRGDLTLELDRSRGRLIVGLVR